MIKKVEREKLEELSALDQRFYELLESAGLIKQAEQYLRGSPKHGSPKQKPKK